VGAEVGGPLPARGEAAFEPRSRRPHGNPQRTPGAVEDAIVALRKQLAEAGLDAGAETIACICASRPAPAPLSLPFGGCWSGALMAALAFFVVGSPSANAFGSEVLGCDAGGVWVANSCMTTGSQDTGTLLLINFSPGNTSGTYTTSWVVKTGSSIAIT
jgi:hypothetical protein